MIVQDFHIMVSIPFSTIKSSRHYTPVDAPFRFQFHLVRLKASTTRRYDPQRGVSIPFSTIKRVPAIY